MQCSPALLVFYTSLWFCLLGSKQQELAVRTTSGNTIRDVDTCLGLGRGRPWRRRRQHDTRQTKKQQNVGIHVAKDPGFRQRRRANGWCTPQANRQRGLLKRMHSSVTLGGVFRMETEQTKRPKLDAADSWRRHAQVVFSLRTRAGRVPKSCNNNPTPVQVPN